MDFSCPKNGAQKSIFSYNQLKNRPFSEGQEKSNFQKFSAKFCISLEGILNYLNINFYEKILKIGFFLAEKLDRQLQWRRLYIYLYIHLYENKWIRFFLKLIWLIWCIHFHFDCYYLHMAVGLPLRVTPLCIE